MSNADKIIWSPAAIDELKKALAGSEPFDDDLETDEALGLLPPWPIVVSSQSSIIGDDGGIETTAVLTFDEVLGATGYQVRISPLGDLDGINFPETFSSSSTETDSWSADGTNYYEHTATPAQTIQAGDIGLVVGPAHTVGYSGGFSSWTSVYDGGGDDELGIWKGTGVGTGSVVCNPGGSLYDRSFFVLIIIRGATSLTTSIISAESVTSNAHQVTYSGGSGTLPVVGDIVTWNAGADTGKIVQLNSGTNVSGVLTLRKDAGETTPDSADVLVSGGWTADVDSVADAYPSSISTPRLPVLVGRMVLAALRTDGSLSNRWGSNGLWTDYGFNGSFRQNSKDGISGNGFYNNGVACSIGIATGTNVYTEFGVNVNGNRGGETATIVFDIG